MQIRLRGGQKTHGMNRSKEHRSWKAMKGRCYNVNSKDYQRYGARGIIVCDRWLNNFQQFFDDMGECPEGFVLDRIEYDGNYCKENCRWVDKNTSAANSWFPKNSNLPRGVSMNSSGFMSRIRISGKSFYLGTFSTIEEAKKVYDDVCLEWYGQQIN